MEKYLVEISIPALGQTVDARLPGGVTFAQAARLPPAARASRRSFSARTAPLIPPTPKFHAATFAAGCTLFCCETKRRKKPWIK